jgi:hypothetical protein
MIERLDARRDGTYSALLALLSNKPVHRGCQAE